MKYRREIDGLRTVAVLPVILFHAGFSIFSGGYVGVDVFFVISGYLITTILISERQAGTYSLLRFYERRARRILPALFVVMAVCIPFAWLRMPPYIFEDFARSMAFAALFVSNVHFWENTGYFALDAELQPLLHTWSLAVEEQYYLLFPLLLMALGVFRRQKFTLVFLVAGGLSLALSEWGWRNYPNENFFFTFSRFWELLAGSLCAVWLSGRAVQANNLLAGLGLGLIVFAIFAFDGLLPFPSLYTLVPVVGAMLIILFAGAGTLVARALSLGPMVGIGLISYSAYLWHQPLFAFARIWSAEEPGAMVLGALAVASLALAYLTWRFVEQPFRRKPVPALPRQGQVFGASLAGIVVFVAYGLWGFANEGFKGRLDAAMTPYFESVQLSLSERSDYNGCYPSTDESTRFAQLCEIFVPDAPQRTIGVIGDSHAMSILPGFAPVAEKLNATIMGAAMPACPPLIGVTRPPPFAYREFCRDVVRTQVATLIEAKVEAVMLVARWSLYATDGYFEPEPEYALVIDGDPVAHDPEAALRALEAGLEQTVRAFTEAGIKVVLVRQVPAHTIQPKQMVERAMLLQVPEADLPELFEHSFVERVRHDALQARANSVLDEQAGPMVSVISLDEAFAKGDRFAWLDGDKSLYNDADHLSLTGAARAGRYLADILGGHLP